MKAYSKAHLKAWIAVILLYGPLTYAQSLRPNTIYGEDGRRDFFEVRSKKIRNLARKSVALVSDVHVSKAKTSLKILKGNKYGKYFKMCPDERFFDQPSLSFCSGVLVTERHVLTAAHCIKASTCPRTSFVFDYLIDDRAVFDPGEVSVPAHNIYQCGKVVQRVQNRGFEFALVELDRPVFDRDPIALKDEVVPTGNLVTIGYPQGIPLKISLGGQLRKETKNYYIANLDALSGNSGSPVYNNKLEFLGILLRGEKDYEYDRSRGCYKKRNCSETSCSGETVLKVSAILERLTDSWSSNP